MQNALNLKRWVPMLGVMACWFALAGCPGLLRPYRLFNYLPLVQGNSWSFGCVAADTGQTVASQELSVSKVMLVAGKTVWVTSQKSIPSDGSAPTYSGDVYYVFHSDVLYSTNSLRAVEDLPDSLDTAFKAVVHDDLTPREIDDANDPVVKQHEAAIRYSAGALEDFLPIAFVRQGKDGVSSASGAVDIADFGEGLRDLADCIALETNANGDWTPAYIFGRDVGPLLAPDGIGGYVALQSANVRCALKETP
ncbi:MAG TPA: hypothetical protein PLO37_03960 [Candidatus Hydrogenedentes bacterium]|nr:hypothetical protein [Candidatus Hydrogenedentota bacterium]HPG65978.1 hypothetical protein [Candidatus Hydrogenedentota bacterium]